MNSRWIEGLGARFGTPLYLYDGERIERQHHALRSCLPQGFGLCFAVKANPLAGILGLFRGLGCGAEAASEGELRLSLAAGFSPETIVYTSPGKTREGVALALRSGVVCITIESFEEAELIDAVAGEAGRDAPVVVRVNPAQPIASAALRMAGGPSQFGIDEEALGEVVEHLRRRFPRLLLVGVHVYAGTQVLSSDAILRDAERTLEMSVRASREHGFALKVIDIGGGFGVPYQDGDGELDLRMLREGYQDLWARYRARIGPARVIAESGRFLAADAGVFVTRVLSTKMSRGTRFVVCDGGYSNHPASAHIARCGQNRYPIEALSPSGEREKVTVVGPTGTPVDILARDVWLDRVRSGDLLVVGKSGAYGYTNSCQLFFSAPSPAEILVHKGEIRVLRERGRLGDA